MLPPDQRRWFDALEDSLEPWEFERIDDEELEDAFSRNVTFGTGGIRALMGVGPNRLNRLTVARASHGLSRYLLRSCGADSLVVVAYDTRRHSREFALATVRTLACSGIRAVMFKDPQPTPVLSYAVRKLGAMAGVVITASHNSMEYNGYKVYGPEGEQATERLAQSIQAEMAAVDPFEVPLADDDALLSEDVVWVSQEIVRGYEEAVLRQSVGVGCAGLRVVYSPLNGTGIASARHMLDHIRAEYSCVPEQSGPDGTFPTCPAPNPEHERAMRLAMRQALSEDADLAVANDPDADRIGVAMRHGSEMRLLTGDEVSLLLLDFLCQTTSLPPSPIAMTTIVSSPLLDSIASANGIALRRTLTGFKYIGEQLNVLERQGRLGDFVLGVEESCGYLRGSYVRDKDGLIALVLACEMAAWHKAHGRDLASALDDLYGRYGYMVSHQISHELPGVDGRSAIHEMMRELREKPCQTMAGLKVMCVVDYQQETKMPGDPSQTLPPANVIEFDLEHGCRLIVRPSGTEPKVKAYCFAGGRTLRETQGRLSAMVSYTKDILRGD